MASDDAAVAKAENMVKNVTLKNNSDKLPPDAGSKAAAFESQRAQATTAAEQAEKDKLSDNKEIEKSEWQGKLALFFLVGMFSLLLLLGIFAIIFYGLDKLANLFEFDLSDITVYIMLGLFLMNLMMSVLGCCGVYGFSETAQDNKKKLKELSKDTKDEIEKLKGKNDKLKDVFRGMTSEIEHFKGENQELKDSLANLEQQVCHAHLTEH